MEFKHFDADVHASRIHIYLEQDMKVFGVYRAVTKRITKKEYRIVNGEVCVKFRREWVAIEESDSNRDHNNWMLKMKVEIAQDTGRGVVYGIDGHYSFA